MEIENEVTISTHNGSQVARQHNLRNPKVIAKEDHIDPDGHFEVWLDEDPKAAYERLFGEAVRAYRGPVQLYTISSVLRLLGLLRLQ